MVLPEALQLPNPVNDYAARATAGLVVALAVVSIVVNQWWLYAIVAIGFALRVAGGPKYSPFGRLAVHVIVPKIWKKEKLVPGPPKRFAQTVGLTFGIVATVLSLLGFASRADHHRPAGRRSVPRVRLRHLPGLHHLRLSTQRVGIIPETVCEACNNSTSTRRGHARTVARARSAEIWARSTEIWAPVEEVERNTVEDVVLGHHQLGDSGPASDICRDNSSVTSAPAPITSTRPGCITPSAAAARASLPPDPSTPGAGRLETPAEVNPRRVVLVKPATSAASVVIVPATPTKSARRTRRRPRTPAPGAAR